MLINDVISFELPGPDLDLQLFFFEYQIYIVIRLEWGWCLLQNSTERSRSITKMDLDFWVLFWKRVSGLLWTGITHLNVKL